MSNFPKIGCVQHDCVQCIRDAAELSRLRAQVAALEPKAAGYEYLRKLTSRELSELWADCIVKDLRFDDEVARRIASKTAPTED